MKKKLLVRFSQATYENKFLNICSLTSILTILISLLWGSLSIASSPLTTPSTQACQLLEGDVFFNIMSASGEYQQTIPCSVIVKLDSFIVLGLDMKITWQPSELTLTDVDFSVWSEITADTVLELLDTINGKASFRITHLNHTFPDWKTVAVLWVRLNCSPSCTTSSIRFSSLCNVLDGTYFVTKSGNVYGPNPYFGFYKPGDVNIDGSSNLMDIIFLINYIFKSQTTPFYFFLADVNADCQVNLGDIIYFVNYVFKSGPAPKQECA